MRVLEGSKISRRPLGRQELAARHTSRAGNPLSATRGRQCATYSLETQESWLLSWEVI